MSATATQPRTRRNDTSNLDANGVFRLSRQRNADGNVLAPLGSGLHWVRWSSGASDRP